MLDRQDWLEYELFRFYPRVSTPLALVVEVTPQNEHGLESRSLEKGRQGDGLRKTCSARDPSRPADGRHCVERIDTMCRPTASETL